MECDGSRTNGQTMVDLEKELRANNGMVGRDGSAGAGGKRQLAVVLFQCTGTPLL